MMKFKKNAISGTLESSDIQITITENKKNENIITLESQVKHLFEDEILRVINESLDKHGLVGVNVKAIDKGALNTTITARVQTAIYRATDEDINWEVL